MDAPIALDFVRVRVADDHEARARLMAGGGLPPEFVETVRTGWWTTCSGVFLARERKRGRF
jgi:hypothetical protein